MQISNNPLIIQHFWWCLSCNKVEYHCCVPNPRGPLLPPPCSCCSGDLEMDCECGGFMTHRLARDVTGFAIGTIVYAIVCLLLALAAAVRHSAWCGLMAVVMLSIVAAREILYRLELKTLCEGIRADATGAPDGRAADRMGHGQ